MTLRCGTRGIGIVLTRRILPVSSWLLNREFKGVKQFTWWFIWSCVFDQLQDCITRGIHERADVRRVKVWSGTSNLYRCSQSWTCPLLQYPLLKDYLPYTHCMTWNFVNFVVNLLTSCGFTEWLM